ncbi:MAG: DUF932 domain-containing protein [Myxococcaceae bacterium]|nr:DUF932 domain-containing protein [Myxococcaceae bacterium]
MAHQIFQDRRMFYSGATPWHGLGTKLPYATWSDIAPMFPRVDERPLVMAGGAIVPDMKALVSSDDGRYLATVGADYKVVQAESVASAILTAAAGAGAVFHTGGLLGERGARGWLLGELPAASFRVTGDDSEVRAYFLGAWGHDGRTPVTLANVSTRVVCQNTVSAALGERGNFRVNVRHTSGAEMRLDDAAASFRALHAHVKATREFAERAAAHRMTRAEVDASLDALFPRTEDETPRQRENRENAMGQVVTILGGDTVSAGIRSTAWGLMQAASEFAEHFTARMTDAQRQVDAIAARSLDNVGELAHVYATIGNVVGLRAA